MAVDYPEQPVCHFWKENVLLFILKYLRCLCMACKATKILLSLTAVHNCLLFFCWSAYKPGVILGSEL